MTMTEFNEIPYDDFDKRYPYVREWKLSKGTTIEEWNSLLVADKAKIFSDYRLIKRSEAQSGYKKQTPKPKKTAS